MSDEIKPVVGQWYISKAGTRLRVESIETRGVWMETADALTLSLWTRDAFVLLVPAPEPPKAQEVKVGQRYEWVGSRDRDDLIKRGPFVARGPSRYDASNWRVRGDADGYVVENCDLHNPENWRRLPDATPDAGEPTFVVGPQRTVAIGPEWEAKLVKKLAETIGALLPRCAPGCTPAESRHDFSDPYARFFNPLTTESEPACKNCGGVKAFPFTTTICVPDPEWRQKQDRLAALGTHGAPAGPPPPRYSPPAPAYTGLGAMSCGMWRVNAGVWRKGKGTP